MLALILPFFFALCNSFAKLLEKFWVRVYNEFAEYISRKFINIR